MNIKNASVRLATVVLVLAAGLPLTAIADKVVKMDMRFAGNGIAGALPSVLQHVTAVGRPGRAEIRGFGGTTSFGGFPADCLGIPFGLNIVITEAPAVFTFKDLSLLFAKGGSGEICFDLTTGNTVFVVNLTFMGGRGRFEGATGQAVLSGEAEPVSSDGSFLGQTGTIVGWINLPDD